MTKAIKKAPQKPETKTAAKHPRTKMFSAKPAIEISATFKDTMGLTAKVAAAVAAEKVNIQAASGYSASAMFRKAIFTLIVDDYAKAEKALEKIGAVDIEESSVVLVDMANKVGALEKASKIIADAGINIYYFYATTSTGETATCLFKTADDKKTIRLLNKISLDSL
jgi:hypothetical protein